MVLKLIRSHVLVFAIAFLLLDLIIGPAVAQNVIQATPSDYLGKLRNLGPGDTLMLEPGVYDDPNDVPGLPFFNKHGEPGRPIVVTGPDSGARPVFLGRSTHNTVRFDDASYIVVRNIEIDGRDLGGDGINAQGIAHHITLENIIISGVSNNRSTVGISTNSAPTWNWVISKNTILGAGTGMYLGNSDGNEPFIAGVIEHNLILDTIGYNIQIKHQNIRPSIPGMPTEDSTTIIRHNVFSKANNSATGAGARPNLLVGHFPPSGSGTNDVYQIYGNFFYQNPSGEPLFQGEGNVALHNNLFFNNAGDAILVQPHNDVPKMIRIFSNTVVASAKGITVTGGSSSFQQKVIGNAIFAVEPIRAEDQVDNIIDAYDAASTYLNNPTGTPEDGTLDLFPRPGKLVGTTIDTSAFDMFVDWNKDFNGAFRAGLFRGAYEGEGQNPGWLPKLEIKPISPLVRPSAPTGLTVQ